MSVATLGVFVGASLLLPSAPTWSLSCAEVNEEEVIARTPVPFIGRVVEQSKSNETWTETWTATYEVEESFRVELPDLVEVRVSTYWDSAPSEPARSGVVMAHLAEDGHLTTSIGPCETPIPAELLRSYFHPLPAPTGEGPVDFLVGTKLGGARVAALDGNGEALAYGFGPGSVGALAICPGEQRVVELVSTPTERFLADVSLEVRDLATMETIGSPRIVRTQIRSHSVGSWPLVSGFNCHSSDGLSVSYLTPRFAFDAPAELHLWEGDRHEVIPSADAVAAEVDGDMGTAYLLRYEPEATVTKLDLVTGEEEVFYRVPAGSIGTLMDLTTDGKYLAVAVRSPEAQQPSLFLVLLSTSGDEPFEVYTPNGASIIALAWSGHRAAFTMRSGYGVTTGIAHPQGWVGRPVAFPDFEAETAVVGAETLIQLGEESVAVSSLFDPEPYAAEAIVYPTIGVAVPGSISVDPEARLRTVGDRLPAESFEPLSAATLRFIEAMTADAAADQSLGGDPSAVEAGDTAQPATDGSDGNLWPLLGAAIALAVAAAFLLVSHRGRARRSSREE